MEIKTRLKEFFLLSEKAFSYLQPTISIFGQQVFLKRLVFCKLFSFIPIYYLYYLLPALAKPHASMLKQINSFSGNGFQCCHAMRSTCEDAEKFKSCLIVDLLLDMQSTSLI